MNIGSLPEVPGGSLFGHNQAMRGDRLAFYRAAAAAGPLVRVRFLWRTILFVNTPQLAHELLVENARSTEKSPGLRLLLHYLGGNGLFTSEGELWRRQRKLMAPLFQPAAIGQYASCMNEVAERVMDGWAPGQRLDLAREMTRITMGVVGKALFGSDTLDEADDLGEALTAALSWVNASAASPRLLVHILMLDAADHLSSRLPPRAKPAAVRLRALLDEPFLLPGARGHEMRSAIDRLDRRIQHMIDERRRGSGPPRRDLLARLLEARDAEAGAMSDRQVRDEATTLFIAGHETTATSLAWSFYLLARHPEVLARVQAEVDLLPDGPLSFEQAARGLSLTTRVFKEAMRLYPPVEVLARRAVEPFTLGGVPLPRGTITFASPYAVHRFPGVYDEPERFDPDRFSPEAEASRPRGSFLPFGAGPRVCIGSHFALLEGPIVLALALRRFAIELDPAAEIVPESFATLRPKGGVPVTVRPRRPALAAA